MWNTKLGFLISWAFYGFEIESDRKEVRVAECERCLASFALGIKSSHSQLRISGAKDVIHLAFTARPGNSGVTGADIQVTGR